MSSPSNVRELIVSGQTLDGLIKGTEGPLPPDPAHPASRDDAYLRAAHLARLNQARRRLREEEKEIGSGLLVAPNDGFLARLQSALAEAGVGETKEAPGGGLEIRFEEGARGLDAGWLLAGMGFLKPPTPHARPEAGGVEPLPNNARVMIVGDWGTGLYGAPVTALTIGADPRPLHLLIHLGDVYYSGTSREIQDRFLALWPKRPDAMHRALNGNHEMYSGGHAYFDLVLPAFQQRTSYFACQNDHWTLVGLDTAYAQLSSGHLDAIQLAWLDQVLAQADNRRVILFSHHQLYSTLSDDGPDLLSALGPYLRAGRIHAWYWGHEHLCVLYDRHAGFGLHARCVGHGGIPYLRNPVMGFPPEQQRAGCFWRRLPPNNHQVESLVLDGPNPCIAAKPEKYGPHGYLTLDFNGARLHETVHLPDGEAVWESDLA